MASPNKQQKRAKRAKAKAKQQRVVRARQQQQFGDSDSFDYMGLVATEQTSGATMDWSLYDDEEDDISDEEFESVTGISEAELQEIMLAHFAQMKEAESVSRVAMFSELLRGPTGIIAFAVEQGDLLPEKLIPMLIGYRVWANGVDPKTAALEMSTPSYASDYAAALEIVTQEFADEIDNPDLWDDDENDFVK